MDTDKDKTMEFDRDEILRALREHHDELVKIRKLLEPITRMFEVFDFAIRWMGGKLREK